MAAYAIVDLHILDVAAYLVYQRELAPLLQRAGARYLARGGEFEVLAGEMRPERLVIMEFPAMDVLRNFYDSDAYQALEAQRAACARVCVIAVNGLPEPAAPRD